MRGRRRTSLWLVTTTIAVASAAAAAGASAKVVWLCRPGLQPDPCVAGLSTTVYTPTFHRLRTVHPMAPKRPAIDCFYVYPTVSGQPTGTANLRIDPEERAIALYQAARYSHVCRMFAPMYRQVTLAGIGIGPAPTTTPNRALALRDVENAFATYLRRDNHGRGFVLIGHSQGSFVLRQLIAAKIDPVPAVRRRLVSAILLGGNVTVRRGRGIGGDFRHVPACRSARQLGCVIAFSTFDAPPPSDSLFGRVGGTGSAPPPSNANRLQVLCTNPAALGGGSGILDPIAPSAPLAPGTLFSLASALLSFPFPHPPTVWWTIPGAYSARCETVNGATVLEITARHGAPVPTATPTAQWGLHLLDANIALGNLIGIVQREARAFITRS